MKICFFGTYEKNYSRNQIILEGLKRNKIKVLEVNAELFSARLDSKEHLRILSIIYRFIRKLKLIPITIRNINTINRSDVLFTIYPGHLDVPIAFIVSKLLKKPLFFDPTFSIYQLLIDDFSLLKTNSMLSKVISFFEKMIFSLPDIVLVDTEFQKKYYQKVLSVPKDKMKILPIGADDQIYKPSFRASKNLNFNVVYYGKYNPLHGVEYIIEAARILKNEKNLKFLMIGSGQTYEEALSLSKKYKLTNIDFFPDMTEKNAMNTLAKADIFLGFLQKSPTVFRAIPNKVFQGIALGKVVLTCETKAIKGEFTHKENIYLVKPADSKKIANAILELKNNNSLRRKIAKNGYDLYRNNFTPDSIGKKLEIIISELLKKKEYVALSLGKNVTY